MKHLEIDVEDTFVRYVKARGYRAEKLIRASERGWPDRTVFLPAGRVFMVEFKRPNGKGKLSPQQAATIRQLTALGHEVLETDDADTAIVAFEEALERAAKERPHGP